VTEGASAIDALLLEERRYPPPPEFAVQANAQPNIYERDFDEFDRGDAPELELITLTRYRAEWPYPVAFPPHEPETTLAELLAPLAERYFISGEINTRVVELSSATRMPARW